MKKENIINDLSDKLKMLTQQQEKDKGKQSSEEGFIFFWWDNSVPCRWVLILSASDFESYFYFLV